MTETYDRSKPTAVLSMLLSAAESLLWTVSYHVGVVVNNFAKLMRMLVKGTKTWIVMALRLLLFTLLLMPGWYRLLRYWFFDPFILRNVEYGKGAKLRNVLDVYLPHIKKHPAGTSATEELAPVVIFVSGGAWIIGYKLWSALVARGLATLGLLVVVPDYRNFPQGHIGDMMDDIREATQWTYDHAHRFGGDRRRLVLAGQSAGAHICLSLLVTEYLARKNLSNRILTDFLEAHPPQSSIYASHDLSYPTQSPPTEAESDDVADSPPAAAAVAASQPAPIDEERSDADLNGSSFFSDEEDEHGFSSFDVAPMGRRLAGLGGSGASLLRLAAAIDDGDETANPSAAAIPSATQQQTDGEAPWFSPLVDTSGLHLDAAAGADCALHLDDFGEAASEAVASNAASAPPPLRPLAESTGDDAPLFAAPRIAVLDKVRLYVGISGPLDLVALASHLHARGLDASILHWICAGDLHRYSPALVLAQYATACASSPRETGACLRDFVPVALFHGSHDHTIPCTVSRRFAQLMQDHAGADRVWYREYEGWTHTDAILEAPLAGSADFFCDLAAAVHRFTSPGEIAAAGSLHAQQKVETDDFAHTHHPAGRRSLFQPSVDVPADVPALLPPLAPTWVVQLARFVNPF